MESRINWIDRARAWAITAIVIGHSLGQLDGGRYLLDWLYLFHVPLCLVISGYLFREPDGLKDAFRQIKKLFIRIYIPYIIWGIISIVLYVVVIDRSFIPSNCMNYFLGLFYANGSLGRSADSSGLMVWNTPLWYLSCLICIEAIACLVCLVKFKHKYILYTVLSAAIGCICYEIFGLHSLFMEFESAVYLLPFFFLGTLLKSFETKHPNLLGGRKRVCMVSAALILCGSILGFLNGKPAYLSDGYEKLYLMFIVSASIMCVGFMYLAKSMPTAAKAVTYTGQNTLQILVMHKFPIMFITLILKRLTDVSAMNDFVVIIIGILISIVSIVCCLAAGAFFTRFAPIVVGKRKKKPAAE